MKPAQIIFLTLFSGLVFSSCDNSADPDSSNTDTSTIDGMQSLVTNGDYQLMSITDYYLDQNQNLIEKSTYLPSPSIEMSFTKTSSTEGTFTSSDNSSLVHLYSWTSSRIMNWKLTPSNSSVQNNWFFLDVRKVNQTELELLSEAEYRVINPQSTDTLWRSLYILKKL